MRAKHIRGTRKHIEIILNIPRPQHALPPGPHSILLESYDLLPNAYTEAAGVAFDRQVLENVEALAGVRSASIADWAPLGFGSDKVDSFIPEGYDVPGPNEVISAEVAHVSPGYFSTMQIPLLHGRDFSPEDAAGSRAVVIINQALADRYWPRQDADGKRMKVDGQWVTVIGVTRTANYDGPIAQPQPFFYLPMYQFYSSTAILHVRTIGDPLAIADEVERAVHVLNADLPIFDVSTLDARIQSGSFLQRLAGMFVGVFGALALVLAAVGIYGVIAYNAKQRTHEIGIRRALGAQPRDVFGLVLGQGLRLTMIGLAIGLIVSFALTRFLSSLLFDVTATDPLTFAGVAFLLTMVSLAACYIPARRALRVDPAVALRYE
jgi:predicted permease